MGLDHKKKGISCKNGTGEKLVGNGVAFSETELWDENLGSAMF